MAVCSTHLPFAKFTLIIVPNVEFPLLSFSASSAPLWFKPTQRCAKCWETTKKTLSDRVHVCPQCGHQEDRDINAAQVMLAWASGQTHPPFSSPPPREGGTEGGWVSSSDAEPPSSTSWVSMKQLGALKRRKRPTPTPSQEGNAQRSGLA